jgi:predicted nucleic acid-binding protein
MELEWEGHTIGLRDTFIAAIALTRKSSIATRNIEHFKKVSRLSCNDRIMLDLTQVWFACISNLN